LPPLPRLREGQRVEKKAPAPPIDPSARFVLRTRQPWAEKEAEVVELTEEQKEYAAALKEDKAEKAAAEGKGDHSVFHGKEEKDYQGACKLGARLLF